MDIQFDCFCGGGVVFTASHLQHLVHETGGRVHICQDFGEQCRYTMMRCFTERKLAGHHAFVDAFTSTELTLESIEGPVSGVRGHEQVALKGSARMVVLCSAGENRGILFTFSIDEPLQGKEALFQFVIVSVNEAGKRVTRIVNESLPTAPTFADVVGSADGSAVAVAIGRNTVLSLTKGANAKLVQKQMEAAVHQIAQHYGSQAWVVGKRQMFGLPSSLANSFFLSSLFFLSRGPLMGKVWQHEDDINVTRYGFLYSDFTASLRMIRPRVLVACTSRDDEVKIEEAFPEDGLLHPQVTLLLDIHTHIFLWYGSQVDTANDPAVAALRRIAECLLSARGEEPFAWLHKVIERSLSTKESGGSSTAPPTDTEAQQSLGNLSLDVSNRRKGQDQAAEEEGPTSAEGETAAAASNVRMSSPLAVTLREEAKTWPVVGRLPYPLFYEFREGESMARWLESLLDPSHKDGKGTMAWFKGAVGTLRNVFAQSAPRSFPRTDQYSFKEWSNAVGVDCGERERQSFWG